jgi:hypothetical protein
MTPRRGQQAIAMAGWGSEHRSMRAIHAGLALVAAVVLFCILPVWWAAAQAPVPEESKRCLGCHAMRGFSKKLEDSENLLLQVPPDLFAKSAHAAIGCIVCHADVDPSKHADPSTHVSKPIKSAREYSLAAVQVCQECHADKFGEWQKSIHAALVRAGNASGPVCTSCHQPHTVIKGAPSTLETVPCKSCHGAIFTAYTGSVHAQVHSNGNAAPLLCSSCHGAHDVSEVSSPAGPKTACLACHKGVLQTHQAWLPNAALHFDRVSCPACHAPTAQRRVDLQLVDSDAQTRVSAKVGVPTFETPGKSVDAIALYNLLQTADQRFTTGHATLRGRLEVVTGEQIHQLAPKSQAISDCNTCHSAGSGAFHSVSISVAGPDGLPIRYVANKDVLSSVRSIGSIGGFYAIGGTRIELLDILLMLAVLAGIGVPAAHLLLGVMVRRYLRRHDTPPSPPA